MYLQVLFSWSTSGNYPAGAHPWSATPLLVTAGFTFFTPSAAFAPTAQQMNALFGGISQSLTNLGDGETYGVISNWNPSVSVLAIGGTTGNVCQGAAWDPYFQKWVLDPGVGSGGTPFNLTVSFDGGKTWVEGGSAVALVFGSPAINPTNGDTVAPQPNAVGGGGSGVGGICFWPGSPGVSAGVRTLVPALNASAYTIGTTATTWFTLNSTWHVFAFEQSGGSYTGHWLSSPDGTTWTDHSSILPTTSKSGANHGGGWVVATSSVVMVACLTGATAGTDYCTLIYSASGTGFADATPSFFAGKIVTGLNHSANDGLWGVMLYDGTSSYLYTSPNPTATGGWTLAHTFVSSKCIGLANIGNVWVTIATNVVPRLLASNNVASAGAASTWGAVPYALTAGTFVPACIVSSGTQLLIWNGSYLATSLTLSGGPSAAY